LGNRANQNINQIISPKKNSKQGLIHTLKPLAQGGVHFLIFTPHLAPIFAPICQRSILAHRWRI
jgi:hypothetical protein